MTDTPKNIHDASLKQEQRIIDRSVANEVRKQNKAKKRGDLSSTQAGKSAAQKYRDAVEEQIIEFIEHEKANGSKTKSAWLKHLDYNPTEVTAELTLRVCIDALTALWDRNNLIMHLGEAINASILNFHLRNTPEGKDLLKAIDGRNKSEGGSSYTMRKRAIYIASKKKMRPVRNEKGKAVHDEEGNLQFEEDPTHYSWEPWDESTKVKVGGICLSAVLKSLPDVFVDAEAEKVEWDDEHKKSSLRLTEEAEENLLAELDYLSQQSTLHAPIFDVPNDWGSNSIGPYNTTSLNYLTPIVKNMGPEQEEAIEKAMLKGDLDDAMAALNTLQSVPYEVNEYVYEALLWAKNVVIKSKGSIKIEGFPNVTKVDVPKIDDEYEQLDNQEKAEWQTDRNDCRKHNREVGPNRMALNRRLDEAKNLINNGVTKQFYLPHNWDTRGRVYHLADFGFQNTDYLRAMFMFANKGKVTKDNEHHLKIQVTTMYGHGEDKQSFNSRIKWFDENKDKILSVGADFKDPENFDFWRNADEPFQFLAACREAYNYEQHGEGYKTGLPIAKDATCSGIQFYAMIGRNYADGKKVNLVDGEIDKPDDLYDHVKEKVIEKVTDHRDRLLAQQAEDGELTEDDQKDLNSAIAWLEFGITRGICKGPTMTWSYSSGMFGFQREIRKKVMAELSKDIRQGRLEEHPFGKDKGNHASWYLAKVLEGAIKDTVESAHDGMMYIQKMAALCFKNDLHLHFVTPLNFPSFAWYRDWKKSPKRIEMPLWDGDAKRMRKDKANLRNYIDDSINTDKSMSASSPNFIHSLDATLLMMSVNLCRDRGVKDIMAVHDSFSTTIDNVDDMVIAIKRSFVTMFEDYCPYDALMQQTMQRIASKVELPGLGSLDINDVLKAKYPFS